VGWDLQMGFNSVFKGLMAHYGSVFLVFFLSRFITVESCAATHTVVHWLWYRYGRPFWGTVSMHLVIHRALVITKRIILNKFR
jgi:hypothetical protein